MSGEATEVVETAAKDTVEAVDKGMGHLAEKVGEDVPNALRASSKSVKGVEESTARDFENIGRHDAAGLGHDASSAAGTATSDVTRSAGRTAETDAETLATREGRTVGEDGATDDPVDVVSGEMFLPQEDLSLPGVLPLVLERRHGSYYRHGRYFGTSWSSTLDQRVVVTENEIRFATSDGRILRYPVPEEARDRVMPSRGPRWPLSWDRNPDSADGPDEITIEQGDLGRTLHFPVPPHEGEARPLAAVTDRAGNEFTFDCDGYGVISDIRHSGGYHVKVATRGTITGIRVTGLSVADPAGGEDITVREFRYDFHGRLTGVVNFSGLPLLFEYDDLQRITRWEDRNGYEYRYTYRDDGRVVRGEGSEGFLNVSLDYDLQAQVTTVTDALGNVTEHHWNDRLQVTRVIDPLGHETRTEKDEYGNLLSTTDPLGRTTRIDRDEYGDPVRVTRPDGGTASISYSEARQPIEAIGADGAAWRYAYGEHGWLSEETDPAGAVTRYEHDDQGRLTAVADALNNVTRTTCDAAGLPTEVTDPLGRSIAYQRDAFGRITAISDSLGAVTRFGWMEEGKLRSRTRADGTSESWEYDPEGNLLAYVGAGGQVTRFEYEPVRRVDSDGAVYQFAYTPQLQLESVTNAVGGTWQYERDAAGNLTSETDFNGARYTYTHDAAGQLVGRANQAGQQITYERDLLGQVVGRSSGQERFRYDYDLDGRLVHAECPGSTLDCTRDTLGRVLTETVNGRTVETFYDAVGRRIGRTTPSGATSEWAYDPAGQTTHLQVGADTIEFAYDLAGNGTSRSLGARAMLAQSFDAVGRLTGQGIWALEPSGLPSGTEGEALAGRRGVQKRNYAYGNHGLPVEINDHLRGTRTFALDPVGRVTAVQAAGWREEYAYDALGNVAAAQVAEGGADEGEQGARDFVGAQVRRAGRSRYEYDPAGRLIRQTRRTLSGQVKTWSYSWDASDQLVSVSTPSKGTWHYVYDPMGRRVAKQRIGNQGEISEEIWFSWDGSLVVEQGQGVSGGHESVLTWDYQEETFTPIAQTCRMLSEGAGQEEIDRRFFAIVSDLIGAPQELVASDGELAWRNTVSVWGRVIGDPGSEVECPLRFPGQYYDEETGFHYNLNRYYDPAVACFISPDPLGLAAGPNPTAYVDNPFTELDPLGLTPYTRSQAQQAPKWKVEVVIHRSEHPESAQHIEDAQKAGHPDVLTIDRPGEKANRRASLRGIRTAPGKQRDEYPPAMFKEGGAGASVRLIRGGDNGGAGTRMGNILRPYPDGTKVKISVAN